MQQSVPCWHVAKEPNCPMTKTHECVLWSPDSFAYHIMDHKKPAQCPFAKRTDSKPSGTQS